MPRVTFHRESQCAGKVRYASRREALARRQTTTTLRDVKHKRRLAFVVYACAHCAGFHLGTERTRETRLANRKPGREPDGGED